MNQQEAVSKATESKEKIRPLNLPKVSNLINTERRAAVEQSELTTLFNKKDVPGRES